ncbi:electron transfer flavoprotein subunit beta/FixA family protein [Effusibacillus lacus]|uniref:Electron transfer flavoprotein subunit beta n=1 Tax=Effusibacillus lacus TaxID=1348429 RepID=A0A292YHZ5_9BACL|nr:electron transfer flavoprotein subunit beta/FixA family protein [Effusibacillus lacus]TCS74554.1 electron transfer flavoprotein beta subunit [Effusibacillus lacus]GAX88429.1 electron transfer flavoprotein subunit beta [Effusibacillus lacus]
MKILVLMKQTFDTEEKIVLDGGKVKEDGVQFIINPYDEYAIEEAIVLRDKFGGEVTVVTLGPARAEEALRKALAMGADHGVHINDEALFGDEYKAAKVLAEYIKTQEYDIILGGNMSVDDGSGQVAVRVAELLGIPHISTITKLEIDGTKVTAHRDAEGDLEIVEATLPVLVTAQQGLNEPRYPSLLGIRKANKIPLHVVGAGDLNVSASAKNEVVETYLPKEKTGGRILKGDTPTRVKELVSLLRNEDKVI